MFWARRRGADSDGRRDFERALRERVARPSSGARAGETRLVFDAAGDGVWTILLRDGEVRLLEGRSESASATLISDAATFVEVLSGRTSGVEAFLRGRLSVRGNLLLPLELDQLLPPPVLDVRTPRCRTVEAAGLTSFFLDAGPREAPPVVLLHGLGATSASFLPTLWDLARDHRVLAVDLPGFGASDKPIRPLHAPFFARWVTAFLDAVGLSRAHLVGNSMGGRIALEAALRAPDRVDRLVLLAPSLAWLRYRFAVSVVRLLRPEMALLPVPVLRRIVIESLRAMFARPDRIPASAMLGAADEFLRIFGTPRGRIAFFHAAREIYLDDPFGRRGFWDRLPNLSRPSLFLFGDKDVLVPHGFARHVERALPRATVVVLEDCGHVPQFEQPDRTHALMRRFLRGDHGS